MVEECLSRWYGSIIGHGTLSTYCLAVMNPVHVSCIRTRSEMESYANAPQTIMSNYCKVEVSQLLEDLTCLYVDATLVCGDCHWRNIKVSNLRI
ncbi:hypothetical protein NPIL_6321 [Nephila pilipes]|uniref:Uncharacterized protein n=1 Tax=Nephila pilipes TaxID=299642 RepID=A0A8X6MEB5_NEPPI|nr:hypothetical protein NPIL_6321 [Nephila pilipes]